MLRLLLCFMTFNTAVRELVAYKLRVMCSHVRRRHDINCAGLERINDKMTKAPNTEPVAKKPRNVRVPQLNPFVNFRHDTDSENEEPTTVVATWFDAKMRVAKLLTNHGDTKLADIYTPDATGMIKAEWIDPKACMSIELPASCLKDGAITILCLGSLNDCYLELAWIWRHRLTFRLDPAQGRWHSSR